MYRWSVQTVGGSLVGSALALWQRIVIVGAPVSDSHRDSDADGMTDAQDVIAGTAPDDARSVFQVATMQRHRDGGALHWVTEAERHYVVAYAERLEEGMGWSVLTDFASDDARGVSFEDADAVRLARPTGFHRVRVERK